MMNAIYIELLAIVPIAVYWNKQFSECLGSFLFEKQVLSILYLGLAIGWLFVKTIIYCFTYIYSYSAKQHVSWYDKVLDAAF